MSTSYVEAQSAAAKLEVNQFVQFVTGNTLEKMIGNLPKKDKSNHLHDFVCPLVYTRLISSFLLASVPEII